jgi:4-aminobutyrate aminotransferase-like enzyme
VTVQRTGGGWRSWIGLQKPEQPKPEIRPAPTTTPVDVADQGHLGQTDGNNVPVDTGKAERGAVKPWETRAAVGPPADAALVAKTALLVAGGVVPLEVLLEPLRSQVAESLKDTTETGTPGAMKAAYRAVTSSLNPESVQKALGALAVAANDAAHAAASVANHPDEVPQGKDDSRDWHRTWGLRLLPDEDPTFRDPEYLVALNQESKGVRAQGFEGRTSTALAKEKFEAEWAKLAPNTKVLAYAESGSDAVSLCFQLATALGRRRIGDITANPEMLYFDGVYAGGRGLAASMNFAGWGRTQAPRKDAFKLPSPTSTTFPPKVTNELIAAEKAALDQIRKQVDAKPPIGAIFIEPVQGAKGVLFYRPEFMHALRSLADELKLPIIADEVLTGGGRTGKFFAYEHYQGFEPDFVVFGKGLECAGIAAVRRKGQVPSQMPGQYDMGVTTAGGDSVRMLKGAQVMKRIREGNLMERAATTGAYLTSKLRDVQQHHGVTPDASGLGMLIGMTHVNGTKYEVSHSWATTRDRYMPPLTLTTSEAELVVNDLMKKLPDENLPKLRDRLEAMKGWVADYDKLAREKGPLQKDEREDRERLLKDIAALDADIKRREA